MSVSYDVAAIGNAIVDVIAPADDAFLVDNALAKGAMTLIDAARARELYARMAAGIETSGGSAGNTVAGVASLGGRAAYVGKVANDQLGEVFIHDTRSLGVHFQTAAPELRRGDRPLPDQRDAGRRAHHVHLPGRLHRAHRGGRRCGGDRGRGDRLPGGLPLRSARGAPRLRQGRGPCARVGPHARDHALGRLRGRAPPRRAAGVHRDRGRPACSPTRSSSPRCSRPPTSTPRPARSAASPGSPRSPAARRARWSSPPRLARSVEAFPVDKLVDTTGAGDQYAAGFMLALARGRPLADCARLGGLAAAEVISHYGPRPQVSLAELAAAHGLA